MTKRQGEIQMTKQVVNRRVIRKIREPLTPIRRMNFQLLLLNIKVKSYTKKRMLRDLAYQACTISSCKYNLQTTLKKEGG